MTAINTLPQTLPSSKVTSPDIGIRLRLHTALNFLSIPLTLTSKETKGLSARYGPVEG